jgi:pimeloyl-ACP methyl ester carboxylesterase
MPRARTNGIEIEYEVFGSSDATPLLLVMGLGAQMIFWDEEFCEGLAERGHRVIRFDNRDVGRSTILEAAGVPNVLAAMAASQAGGRVEAPYTLDDMADDAAGLLDALELDAAHVVGASMGGMIAQTLAIRHPQRVRTLTSIMSTTGRPGLPGPTPAALGVLLAPPVAGREANVERGVATWRVIGSPGFPFDEPRIRERAGRAFDWGFHPEGVARQLAAILASGSRHERLASVRAATLVIHGQADPLVPVACGADTADAVPGAELLLVEGMGHDLPRGAWPTILDAIGKLTARA